MEFRALLIQIRQNPEVLAEERLSFATSAGLKIEQVHTFNVFDHQSFDFHLLKPYNCAFIGGASEASVLKPNIYPFVPNLEKLMIECAKNNFPTFASCFGFQVALQALGGEIIRDEDNYEMGTYPMKLTHAAANDPVFKGIPDNFMAVSVHQERCIKMPEEVELLASTDLCPHAFKVKNKDFWGFQFHPELNKENLISRLAAYQEQYTDDSNHYNSVINALSDTDDAQQLVKNFVSYVKSLMN